MVVSKKFQSSILVMIGLVLPFVVNAAFVTTPTTTTTTTTTSTALLPKKQSTTSRKMWNLDGMDGLDALSSTTNFVDSMNNLWLATIDSDIDSIPTNEFSTVFAGGIVVMFGGVLSALIVGFILEKGDLYANVIADSYAQSAEDEEFWKGLSDEETKKTKELLERLKQAKGESTEGTTPIEATNDSKEEASNNEAKTTSSSPAPTSKPVDMFSDYGDSS